MLEWIRRMPKVELHVHLDGSLRLNTLEELAAAAPENVGMPVTGDLRGAVVLKGAHPLEDYLAAFDYTVPVLQTPSALTRAAYELCADAAAENVIYIEPRFAPLLHTRLDLKPRDVVAAVLLGLRQAHEEFGIETGLLLTALRQNSTEESIETVQLAAQFRREGVVGFDLAGPERLFPLLKHRKAVEFAHDAGLHVTLHAGEGCCPEQIREAIDLGADRIGHGVHLLEAPRTERRVAELGIPLEMCPTSNLQVGGFLRSYKDHPIQRYLELGIPVTVNTDNRLMSAVDLSHEFRALVRAFSWTRDIVHTVTSNAIRAAFVPEDRKAALQARVDAFFSSHRARR
ncbi:MAG: adenosine deaminase [Candidatus Bipolaricaulota bacterium]